MSSDMLRTPWLLLVCACHVSFACDVDLLVCMFHLVKLFLGGVLYPKGCSHIARRLRERA